MGEVAAPFPNTGGINRLANKTPAIHSIHRMSRGIAMIHQGGGVLTGISRSGLTRCCTSEGSVDAEVEEGSSDSFCVALVLDLGNSVSAREGDLGVGSGPESDGSADA